MILLNGESGPVGWHTGYVTPMHKYVLPQELCYETTAAHCKLTSLVVSSAQMGYVLRFQSSLTTVSSLIQTGKPFMYVHATDPDDPTTPHAQLTYSILHHFPNPYSDMLFQIDSTTGAISPSRTGMSNYSSVKKQA